MLFNHFVPLLWSMQPFLIVIQIISIKIHLSLLRPSWNEWGCCRILRSMRRNWLFNLRFRFDTVMLVGFQRRRNFWGLSTFPLLRRKIRMFAFYCHTQHVRTEKLKQLSKISSSWVIIKRLKLLFAHMLFFRIHFWNILFAHVCLGWIIMNC